MATGACVVGGTVVALFVAKYTNRTICGIYVVVLGCIGVIMMFTIPEENITARYGGYILTMQCMSNTDIVTALPTTELTRQCS